MIASPEKEWWTEKGTELDLYIPEDDDDAEMYIGEVGGNFDKVYK